MYKVSLIIPIYNVEQYLPACLDSAVNQTLKDIEIICVDDGSPDNCAQIVAEYMKTYSNIKLIRKENGGLCSARNAGLDIAAGEYVYFLDSDDFLEVQALEKLYSTAAAEQLDVLYFNARSIFDTEQFRKMGDTSAAYFHRPADYSGVCTGQSMFVKMHRDGKFLVPVWIQIYRREFLEENGLRFYHGIVNEESLFSLQCAMTARRVDYIPDVFYIRRIREGSILTSPQTLRFMEGHMVGCREALELLSRVPIEEGAAEDIGAFVYERMFRSACQVWSKLPETERQKPLSHDGPRERFLLRVVTDAAQRETQNARLVAENRQLARKLAAAEKKLSDRTEEKGFFRTASARGLGYAVRKTAYRCRDALTDFMIAHSRGRIHNCLILAKEKGVRFALRQLAKKP